MTFYSSPLSSPRTGDQGKTLIPAAASPLPARSFPAVIGSGCRALPAWLWRRRRWDGLSPRVWLAARRAATRGGAPRPDTGPASFGWFWLRWSGPWRRGALVRPAASLGSDLGPSGPHLGSDGTTEAWRGHPRGAEEQVLELGWWRRRRPCCSVATGLYGPFGPGRASEGLVCPADTSGRLLPLAVEADPSRVPLCRRSSLSSSYSALPAS